MVLNLLEGMADALSAAGRDDESRDKTNEVMAVKAKPGAMVKDDGQASQIWCD